MSPASTPGGEQEAGPFEWKTYDQCWEMIQALGSAIVNDGLVPPSGELKVRSVALPSLQ